MDQFLNKKQKLDTPKSLVERAKEAIDRELRNYEEKEQEYARRHNTNVNETPLRLLKPIVFWTQFGLPGFTRNIPETFSMPPPGKSSQRMNRGQIQTFDKESLEKYYEIIRRVDSSEVTILMPKKEKLKQDARNRVFSRIKGQPEKYQLQRLQYTTPEGMVLMNILLSRFVDVIKIKEIDYAIYTSVIQPIRFLNNTDISSRLPFDFERFDMLVCNSVILGWLKQSGLYDFDKTSSCKILTRRCLLIPIYFKVSTGEMEAHEISIMWQYNHRMDTYAFYIVDNLPIEEYFDRCRNFFNASILLCVEKAFHNLGLQPHEINIKNILNTSEMVDNMFSVEGYERVNYLCTSAARRAALYGARIIDIENTDQWNEKDSHEHFSLHYNFFIHQMHRMLNWLNADPVIWPRGKDEPHNTIDAPDPYVLYNDGVGSVMNYMFTLQYVDGVPPPQIPERLVVKLDPQNSYLKLTNLLNEGSPPVKYYFHLNGGNVFSPIEESRISESLAEDLRTQCTVSSQFPFF